MAKSAKVKVFSVQTEEEEQKERKRFAVQKHREKQRYKNQITISLNDIKYKLLIDLRKKLGYPNIENNEKGTSEIFSNIIGYLLEHESDIEPPEKSSSLYIREIYRRHRIALYWQSNDELSDYGKVQKINQLGISNVDYYYRESMKWDVSEITPEWTVDSYKQALNYNKIKRQYISPIKSRNTKKRNSVK